MNDETDEQRLSRALKRVVDEAVGSKTPLRDDLLFEHIANLQAKFRHALAPYGDTARVSVSVYFDRTTLSMTMLMRDTRTGQNLAHVADVLRALRSR